MCCEDVNTLPQEGAYVNSFYNDSTVSTIAGFYEKTSLPARDKGGRLEKLLIAVCAGKGPCGDSDRGHQGYGTIDAGTYPA
jgi:hypothetical protein